ncbi:DUF3857 domain-containing protein [Alteraurantiacibacter aquimixticola]|uniref:DUF3857 domain-containing protein n=1 Tax=Alteraurantiacibacter aquimixticola TaxID=2489173 RepID=A0A4T3F486_9SPHN|nr:DUF3857 domain-containing protein [Alteraurantiacibacter aquimixticola]TIX50318.1 DUF3857 domain-containing protein [Alteraurantiacibacter aquimixticola]
MRYLRAALFSTAALYALPVHAGEEVLYAAAPDWVEEVTDESLDAEGPAAMLHDWQYRLEGGVEHAYTDAAIRLDNPQALMQAGTLSLGWLPDKGDLTVHRLEILRGDQVIDLLAQGVTFDVLRREQGLEQRLLDGQLTATLAVPGLREGDVLRVAHSISVDDQALGEHVQALQFLPADPWQVGFSRVIMSWPEGEEMYWSAEELVDLPEPQLRDGYKYLELALPLAEPAPVPNDAPTRYRRPSVLRVGSFASWDELSAVMTPHFEAAAVVEPGSEVAEQAAAIMARTGDAKERMALATRLVQDEVSYLLNGLDGGNYLPQTSAETWKNRFGDCKAKSVLLLSLLREMDIESEVVLVTTQGGDAVPELLPLPATFDHMIVHAVIDGTDYWLDGTSAAARLHNIADVPPFHYALPLREGGTGLMAMEQRDLEMPRMAMKVELDHSAGTDWPVLFDIEIDVSGPYGAPLRALVDADNPEVLRQMARSFTGSADMDDARIADIEIAYDEEEAIASVRLSGVANSMFQWTDGRMEIEVEQGEEPEGFNPNRARPAWREIPVMTAGPGRQLYRSRLLLPDGGEGYSLSGDTDLDGGYGNVRIDRSAWIADGAMYVRGETFLTMGEIAPDELSQAKRDARRLEATNVELHTPAEVTWRWQLDEDERQERAQRFIDAYSKAIELSDKDDMGALQSRAMFLETIYAYEDALEDYNELVERTPSSWAFHRRSAVLEALGRHEEAIADLEAAYDLDPQNYTAFALARLMAYRGKTAEAQELLEFLPVSDDETWTLTDLLATVTGLQGDATAGQEMLAEQVFDKPTNADVLNADCWYRGLFNVALDDAMDLCTRAVERASFVAAPLDSRALVRFRLGMIDEALADLDAALELAPHLAPSMYLRGVIRLTAGDKAGEDDITTALRISPQLEEFYARHGIVPPR